MMKLKNLFNGALSVGSGAFVGFMATQPFLEPSQPVLQQKQEIAAFSEALVNAIQEPVKDSAQAQAAARELNEELGKLPATFNRLEKMKPAAFTKSWCEAELKRYDRIFDLSDMVDNANPPLRDMAAIEKADRQILKYEKLLTPCFKVN